MPLSARLRCVADLINEGSRVADIGCDHGFLGIYLLSCGKASHVIASDLREKPLATAKRNAERFGTSDRMEFVCADGLKGIDPNSADTIVFAGMGGDVICMILDAAPWVRSRKYSLLLQPQSGVHDLRAYLANTGFQIEREIPIEDHGFLYSVMQVRFDGVQRELSPGECYLSAAMLREPSPLVRDYCRRMINSITKTLCSLENTAPLPEKQAFFEEALEQLKSMEEQLK